MTVTSRVHDAIRAAGNAGTNSERVAQELGVPQASVTAAIGRLGRAGEVRSIYGAIGPGSVAPAEMVYPNA